MQQAMRKTKKNVSDMWYALSFAVNMNERMIIVTKPTRSKQTIIVVFVIHYFCSSSNSTTCFF